MLLSVGQIRREAIALAIEPSDAQRLARRLVEHGRRATSREHVARERRACLHGNLHVVEHAHLRKDAVDLKAAHDTEAGNLGGTQMRDLELVERDPPRRRTHEARQHAEQRRLARAVGADDGVNASGLYAQGQPVECREAGK